jgi:glycosyltransferase involved in cell wall biosynthesis
MSGSASSDVTIVISSFNQEQVIGEAIRSAQGQTVVCRIVVVDDGSTDRSVELARSLGVEVLERAHSGVVATYRAGVEVVDTEFYVLLNGDDILEPTYVEEVRGAADESGVGVVYTGVWAFGAETGELPAVPFDANRLLWSNFVHGASLVRRRAYVDAGGYDAAFDKALEDWALWVAIWCSGWRFARVPKPLLRYRRYEVPSRNPGESLTVDRVRWSLARRHLRCYGVGTVSLLVLRQLGNWASRPVRRRRGGARHGAF